MPIKFKIIVIGLFLGFFSMQAQDKAGIEYKIIGVDLYCYVNRHLPQATLDSLLETCGISADSLSHYASSRKLSPGHWQVQEVKKDILVLRKPLRVLEGKPQDQKDLLKVITDGQRKAKSLDYAFGYNVFSKPAVVELDNGLTRFYLKITGAKPSSVYLSGTFNDWSTSSLAMMPCDSGYYVDISLAEGGHYYKYIVNGRWLLDPRNRLMDTDWEGNENSVYFKENHVFELEGYRKAEEVYIAGSFNDWRESAHPFIKTKEGWQRTCYLKQGTHAYKLIVDGEWMLDPGNPVVRPDGEGNENSFVAIGDTFHFFYPGELDRKAVWVSGNFNNWNELELRMTRTDSGWVLPYVLAPGNYEYKFILDQRGEWALDPLNPITVGDEIKNSLLVIDPNHHFFYPKVPNTEEVFLSGDFNGWSEDGYKMETLPDGWHIDLHLEPGKYRYKFIVGDKWLRDPSNALFEPNEYGDFNSVLWIK